MCQLNFLYVIDHYLVASLCESHNHRHTACDHRIEGFWVNSVIKRRQFRRIHPDPVGRCFDDPPPG